MDSVGVACLPEVHQRAQHARQTAFVETFSTSIELSDTSLSLQYWWQHHQLLKVTFWTSNICTVYDAKKIRVDGTNHG